MILDCHQIIFGIQIYFESIQDFHHQCYKNNSNINIIIINNLENLDKITKRLPERVKNLTER